jgi:hypothetical protein
LTDRFRRFNDVAELIDAFLGEGSIGPTDWDDFISIRESDLDLEAARRFCVSVRDEHPPERGYGYTNSEGRALLRTLARDLRHAARIQWPVFLISNDGLIVCHDRNRVVACLRASAVVTRGYDLFDSIGRHLSIDSTAVLPTWLIVGPAPPDPAGLSLHLQGYLRARGDEPPANAAVSDLVARVETLDNQSTLTRPWIKTFRWPRFRRG